MKRLLKSFLFIAVVTVVVVCPIHVYFYLIPSELHTISNLLTLIGLLIAYITLWATIGIAIFIYWLQNRNAEREEKRRLEQAKAAMFLAIQNAFKMYFFMPAEDRDDHYCEGVKDVLSSNAGELKGFLTAEELNYLSQVVNTIDKKDAYEANRYVRDWLQILYLSSYQKYMICVFDYEDLLDQRTFNLIQKLKGSKEKYTNKKQIGSNKGDTLFEKCGDHIVVKSDGIIYLDGKLGYNEIEDDPVVMEGFGKTEEYEGYYKDGEYDGSGIQFDSNHKPYNSGQWNEGKLIVGIEYNVIVRVVSGKLIFKPNCPEDPSEDFEYERMEQYADEEVSPLSWSMVYFIEEGLKPYFVVDMHVGNDTEQMTNIRTLEEFLGEENPDLLEDIKEQINHREE
jgi:hypothetical protein